MQVQYCAWKVCPVACRVVINFVVIGHELIIAHGSRIVAVTTVVCEVGKMVK